MSDNLRDEIAAAVHDASCVCGRPLETHVPLFMETYRFRADAVLAVVQKRAEQLAQELDESRRKSRRAFFDPYDRGSAYAYSDGRDRVRSVFGLATREESNQ